MDSLVTVQLLSQIALYLNRHDLGFAFGPDGPVRLRPGRVCLPDVGFVSWERITDDAMLEDSILDAVPHLAAEIINENNTSAEMERKLKEYFKAGVQLVWYIYTKTICATLFTAPTSSTEIDKDGFLDGGKVLPGFRLALSKLFPHTRPRRKANGKGK